MIILKFLNTNPHSFPKDAKTITDSLLEEQTCSWHTVCVHVHAILH